MDAYNSVEDPFAFLRPQFNVFDDSPGLICEIKTYEARYNYRGEQVPLQVGKISDLDPHPHEDHSSALVLTRYYARVTKELQRTELTIRSPFMKNALKEVVKEYPDEPSCGQHCHPRLTQMPLPLPCRTSKICIYFTSIGRGLAYCSLASAYVADARVPMSQLE